MKKLILLFFLCISINTYSNDVHVLHWGINLEPLEYFNIAALKFKQMVEIRTNNTVKVKLTVGKYKQKERDHLADVKNGVYDMGQEVINLLIPYESKLLIWELPFLFQNDEHVFKYVNSEFARKTLNDFSKKAGVRAIEYTYSGGFIHFFGKEVKTLEDIKESVLYTESSSRKYKTSLKEILKLSYIGPYNSTGIDYKTQSSEIISSVLEELDIIAKSQKIYLNTTGHRVSGRILFFNQDFLKKLSPYQREVVLDEAKKAGQLERILSLEASQNYIRAIQHFNKNIILNIWTEKQRISNRKKFSKQYQLFNKELGENITSSIIEMIKTK